MYLNITAWANHMIVFQKKKNTLIEWLNGHMIFLCVNFFFFLLLLYFVTTSIVVLSTLLSLSPDEGSLKPKRFNVDFPS